MFLLYNQVSDVEWLDGPTQILERGQIYAKINNK